MSRRGRGIRFTIALIVAAAAVLASEPAALQLLSGKLYGTLEVPDSKAPAPVVLIIAGSGPTDRDGNSKMFPGANNSLKMLAEALKAQGIASLRYDKRGIAESSGAMGKEEDLRFDNYIDDAAMWVGQLQADKRFSRVYIAGHSEGALIALACAQRVAVAGVVSISGIGRPFFDVLDEQLQGKLPPVLEADYRRIADSLKQGKTVTDVPQALGALFRPSVQPYLISMEKYDPVQLAGSLKMPLLVAQGTTDLQVKVSDARMLSAAAPKAKLLIIEGMNHVLKDFSGDLAAQTASYGDSTLPIDPKLTGAIADFVLGR